MKILVTGSDGQLGSEIQKISENFNSIDWEFSSLKELDFIKLNTIKPFLDKVSPSIIINCAAYTNVDQAELSPDLSDLINHKAIETISKWTFNNNCKLIHISTDYVFDGNSKTPIKENALKFPINTYGSSKLKGENVCLKNDTNSIIIRTSWVYSSFGNNFVKIMRNLMAKNILLNVVDDQVGSPTYAADLAETILTLICYKKWIPGVYHYSNEGEVSWFDFANDIKYFFDFKTQLKRISSEEYPTVAKRPKFSLLDKTKIKETYNIKVPYYKDSLKKCIKILQNEE